MNVVYNNQSFLTLFTDHHINSFLYVREDARPETRSSRGQFTCEQREAAIAERSMTTLFVDMSCCDVL